MRNACFGYDLNVKSDKREVKPLLSDDQNQELEKVIIESCINKTKIELTIYHEGYTRRVQGIVNKIYKSRQKLLFNDKLISFCEIIYARVIDY